MFNLIKCEKDKWQENKNHNSNKYRCTNYNVNVRKVKKWGIFKL